MEKKPYYSIRNWEATTESRNWKEQHRTSEDLKDADMDSVNSFPMTGGPFFYFPQKAHSIGHP